MSTKITLRQKQAIKGALAGLPLSKAMIKAGYAPATARNPQNNLTNKEAWKTLMNEYLSDHKLFKAHEEALEAEKWNEFSGEREPDHALRLRAATEGYKIKGYGNVGERGNIGQQFNISFDGSGYIPPNNVLNIKPTLSQQPKRKLDKR